MSNDASDGLDTRSAERTRRGARLATARRAVDRALDAALDDLSDLVEEAAGSRGPGRLAVFHVRAASDAYALHRIDVAHRGQVITLEPRGADLATWTALYGDLRDIASRFAAMTCPEGLAVLLRGEPASICGYPAEHCGHWNGEPQFALEYPEPMRDALPRQLDHPHCCAPHRIQAALERHGLRPPSLRATSDCDDE